jgi:hypothetical protein
MSATPREGAGPAPPPAAPSPSFEGDPKADAKRLLQDLIFRAELYPDLAPHLELSIRALRRELARTPQSDRSSVILALEEHDLLTFEQLAEETHLLPSALSLVLASLFALRPLLVECRSSGVRVGTKPDPHLMRAVSAAFEHGAMTTKPDKRVEYLFCLTHTPAGSAYSAPARAHSSAAALERSFSD